MILHPTQNIVAADTHRFRILCCGRRWGKTSLAAEEIKAFSLSRPARIAYVATTYDQARSIMWEELKRELKPIFIGVPNESRLEIKVRTMASPDEFSMITLYGWESIERLRGLAFDFVVLDEVASMKNFWSNWEEVIRPTLTDRQGQVLFCSTPKGFNHFYELYNMELDHPEEYKSFHFTSYENPHMKKEEIDKARESMSDLRFFQEYMAEFKKMEGLVYPEFNRDLHLYSELPTNTHFDYLGGVDFGYTHPCAVMHVYKDRNQNYWVDDEWYHTGRTDAQIADYVLSCRFNVVYPDPENPSAIEVMSQKGVNVVEVNKNKDSVKNGINQIRDLFKQNRLKINKKCKATLAELESYHYPDKKGLYQSENPEKENDDCMDALRYVIYSDSSASGFNVKQDMQEQFRRNQQRMELNSAK